MGERGWPEFDRRATTITLREYVDLRFRIQEIAVSEAKRVAQEAVEEAKRLMQDRLDIADQAKQEMKTDIKDLQGIAKIAEGKASQNAVLIALAFAIISALFSAAAFLK